MDIKTEKVKPASSKKENIYLLTIVTILILTVIVLINFLYGSKKENIIEENKISSFEVFNDIENGVYNELHNFKTEIKMLIEEGLETPTVDELSDNMVSPFVKDNVWAERNNMEWIKIDLDEKTYYLGLSENNEVSGNFLVIVDFKIPDIKLTYNNRDYKKEYEDYINKVEKENSKLEKIIIDDIDSFKEIVPFTGNDVNEGN